MASLSQELAVEQLRNLGPDIRLVVIHPNFMQQHLVFSELMQMDAVVYCRFDDKSLTRDALETQLQQSLLTQTDQGRVGGVGHLILDECDRAESKDFAAFVADVLGQLIEGRVIIVTRYPPHDLLADGDLRARTEFVPEIEGLMLWDYARRSEGAKVLLEVRALGTGRVLRDGKSVDSWDGLLPRSLFFFLVDKGMTTRDDIFETFWPNLSVREATNVFHVTKRKISEVLGADLTEYWSGFYHVSPNIELSYDVVRFSELLQDSAVASVDDAGEMLQHALTIYRDDFLTSLNMDWVKNRREELRQSYGEVLIGLAKSMKQQGKNLDALGLYLRASATTPQREDVAREAMLLYQNLDMHDDALKVYTRLKNELQDKLGVAPDKPLQELAGELEQQVAKRG